MSSISVYVHNPEIAGVTRLSGKDTLCVELLGYPHAVNLLIAGGLDGLSSWISDLIEKSVNAIQPDLDAEVAVK